MGEWMDSDGQMNGMMEEGGSGRQRRKDAGREKGGYV